MTWLHCRAPFSTIITLFTQTKQLFERAAVWDDVLFTGLNQVWWAAQFALIHILRYGSPFHVCLKAATSWVKGDDVWCFDLVFSKPSMSVSTKGKEVCTFGFWFVSGMAVCAPMASHFRWSGLRGQAIQYKYSFRYHSYTVTVGLEAL